MVLRVTLIPGDGIGPEVIGAAVRVVEATGVAVTWEEHAVGRAAVDRGEPPLPDAVLDSIRANGTALKGPVSTPAGTTGFRSVNVGLRTNLDLFAQVRPCRSLSPSISPAGAVDVVVIRDTTEDLYAGVELPASSAGAEELIGVLARHGAGLVPAGAGLSIKFASEPACRRIVEFAFRYARAHGRRRVTLVHKATVMRCTDGLLLEVGREVAGGFADIEFAAEQIDSVCAQMVRHPGRLDVVVTTNQYGDILSDVAAAAAGGIGMAPGANFGPDAAVFEPAHGTAPRRAGQGIADPLGAILSAKLLLDHVGESVAASRIETAVRRVLDEGRTRTYDLCDDRTAAASTQEMADAVVAALP